jgi:tetratricopeptide (TPR) repeat protein
MRRFLAAAAILIGLAASPVSGQVPESIKALLGAGKTEEALTALRRLVRDEPANAAAHNALGSILNSNGHYAEALVHAEKAAELEPANRRFRYNRGVVRAEHGRFADAIADFDAALAADPKHPYAWLERGAAKLSLGDVAAARADWAKAAEADHKLIWPIWYEATGDFVAGDFAQAAAGFDRVAAAEPAFASAGLWSAIAHGRAGTATVPAAPHGSVWPAPVLRYLRGELEEAALLTEAARDRISGDKRRTAEAHFFIAQRALIDGKRDVAREHLRQALAIPSPRHVWRIAAERDLNGL